MSSAPKDKFAPFVVSTHAYKTVDDHPILLDIFIPKKLVDAEPGSDEWKVKRPVMLFFHAGWLIGGQRDFQPWWSQWILDLMLKHDAIGITADYRLIPEATCEDVLDDIHDVWEWIGDNLSGTVGKEHPGLRPDLSRILLAGSSAGGYCALQLGLSFYKPTSDMTRPPTIRPRPRAVVALYPFVSIRTPHWTQAYEKNVLGMTQLSSSLLDDHLASIAAYREETGKQPILTSVPMQDSELKLTNRGFLAICAEQHGRILDFFGPECDSAPGKRRMHPEDRIVDGRVLPPTVIIHGTNDTIAPIEGSDQFVEHLRKYKGVGGLGEGQRESDVLTYLKAPGEHIFDTEIGMEGETNGWVKEAVLFIERNWLP